MKITQADIYYLVAKETKIPEDKVKFIIENLWGTVRQYITNPLTSQFGIRINQFIRFEVYNRAVESKLKSNLSEEKLNFYKQLKQIINERWKRTKINN